VAPSV